MKLSLEQIENMKHAIGNERTLSPYRNYFNTGILDESWDELVELELATKSDRKELGGIFYYLTTKGINCIYKITGVK